MWTFRITSSLSGQRSNSPPNSLSRQTRRRNAAALSAPALISLLLLTVNGCSLSQWVHNGFKVGPEYDGPPDAPLSLEWIDAAQHEEISVPPHGPDWWTIFEDPKLDALIRSAYEQNLSLREAGWRVMQARARRAIAAGNLFPQTQEAFGEFDRILESQNVATPVPVRAFDEWSTGFNLSWEIDVWGKFRRAVASADAELEQSVGEYDAVLVCLLAEVATAYADYRTFEQRLVFSERNIEIQLGSLRLAKEKFEAGKTSRTSVYLAESNLEATRATVASFKIGLRQASNRLCTLLGMPVQNLTALLGRGAVPNVSSQITAGVPAELLRRRPDIRAAERAIAAQSEQIGIAETDLYPHFSISGEIALESEKLTDLFSSASSAGSISPTFRWDLLNYGRIINNVRLQGLALEELITRYQNTVLTANQEVEDAIIAFFENQKRVEHLRRGADETAKALELVRIAFEEGDVDFTGVFVLQGQLTARQDALAAAEGDVATSLIMLYKALGGGWEIRCSDQGAAMSALAPMEAHEELPTPPMESPQIVPESTLPSPSKPSQIELTP